VLNRYTQWFGEKVPEFISREINIPKALDITFDGSSLKFPEGNREQVEKNFGNHLNLIEKDKATVKQGHEFNLIAEIIESGSLPFVPKPVEDVDLRESDFTHIFDELKNEYRPLDIFSGKYVYQGDAWSLFLKYGALGIYWFMSAGKTVIGTYCFSRIKGKKALVVPSTALKEQWTEFFRLNCPRLLSEVEIFTYQGMSRKTWKELCCKEYVLIVFDECHFLPADSFSKLATLKTKYRIGLSATPYREDGRTAYIMALTGQPTGLDWRTIMQSLGKSYHVVNVHVVKDMDAKYALAEQLYNPSRRTLFFVYRLAVGERLASMFGLRFISGETKNSLDVVHSSFSFVASKKLEHGLSVKDLEHIIEVDFQFGGRQEQTQRTGRLMHSEADDKIHDIIMTKDELENYGKRLYGLYEKGFRPRIIPHLAGVKALLVTGSKTKQRQRVSKPESVLSYSTLLNELLQEGFFRKAKTKNDTCAEIERRGYSLTAIARGSVGKQLNRMVRQKKLYRTRNVDGAYEYEHRTT
jgi:DNA excision repair protein ERCC-3